MAARKTTKKAKGTKKKFEASCKESSFEEAS